MALLRLSVLALALGHTTTASAAVLTVDCGSGPYFTINSAVVAASSGDTIVVHPCTYNEAVSIGGLSNLSLVAAGSPSAVGSYTTGVGTLPNPNVVIDSSGFGTGCIRIGSGDHVTVTGFKIQNCDGWGIEMDFGNSHTIHGNRIQNTMLGGNRDTNGKLTRITSNIVGLNGGVGIFLQFTGDTTVSDNRVALNGGAGIAAQGDINHVVNNDVTGSGGDGIFVDGFGNRVERNRASGNTTSQITIGGASTSCSAIGNNTAAGGVVDLGVGSDVAENI